MGRRFDGTTQHMFATGAEVSAPFTMACWFNRDAASATDALCSICGPGQSVNERWSLLVPSSGELRGFVNDGASTTHDTTNTFTDGTWNHACLIEASATSHRSVLNGDIGNGSSDATNSIPVGTTEINIAVRTQASAAQEFDGVVAEFAIWNVALNDPEVVQLSRWRWAPTMIRPEHLVWYRSLRFSDYDHDPTSETINSPLISMAPFVSIGAPPVGSHPPHIIYPRPNLTWMLSAGVSAAITEGEIVAATTSFDNRPHKPDTIFVPF